MSKVAGREKSETTRTGICPVSSKAGRESDIMYCVICDYEACAWRGGCCHGCGCPEGEGMAWVRRAREEGEAVGRAG